MAIQDSSKHSFILRCKAMLGFALIHVVTYDFSTPRLIESKDASYDYNTVHSPVTWYFTANNKDKILLVNFNCNGVTYLFIFFLDYITLSVNLSETPFSIGIDHLSIKNLNFKIFLYV